VILDRVSFEARPGQATAVVGPSGSGKSSLLAILAGLEPPDSGTVQRPQAPARTAVILQAYGLATLLTAAENVEIALQADLGRGASRRQLRAAAASALRAVGLADQADHLVEELSGGQQQRVAIARALATAPDIVVADEFTTELDRKAKQQAVELILQVARRGGVVIIATHDPDIAAQCGQIVHLLDGRVEPAAP
jgi:ABC-type lipoprotein export system ATPase subunit